MNKRQEKGGTVMQQLLKDFENNWKQYPAFTDVKAQEWVPNNPIAEKCPKGCQLEVVASSPTGWDKISMRDAYSYETVCREHAFARIYVISGPTAVAHNWKPWDSHEGETM